MIEKVTNVFGGIDTLVLAVGQGMNCRFEDISDISLAEKLISINYLTCVYCTFFAYKHLKQSRGQIVVISGVAGLNSLAINELANVLAGKLGAPTLSLYSAAKHALHGNSVVPTNCI